MQQARHSNVVRNTATLILFSLLLSGCLMEEDAKTQDLTDVDGNSPPVISDSAPAEINAGQTYSFTPTVTDPDSDTFSFTVSGLPLWANFNDTNGQVSGTPQAEHVGTYSGITMTVSDGQADRDVRPVHDYCSIDRHGLC